jgi:YD repeat-containing protein
MVAIVSGNSLGLELTSLGTLGSQGLWGSAGQGNSGEQVYVNAANGNLVVQRRDEFLASRGLDNPAIRTYNSLGLLNDDNVDNWSMGVYAQQLVLAGTVNTAGSTLTRTGRDGSVAIYSWDATRLCYLTTAGGDAHDTIAYNASTGEYSRTDGTTREVEKYKADTVNDPLRLRSVTDADGNATTYNYTGSLLTSVVDKSGDTITYTYAGNNLTKVSTTLAGSSTPRSVVSYGYDASNRLSTVTVDLTPENTADSVSYTTTYTYDGTSKRVKTLTQTDGSSLTFTYVQVGADYRVATITDALGSVTRYDYDTAIRRTTVTDPTGQVWLYDYDAAGQLIKLTSPAIAGTSVTQSYTYDASGNVTKITNGDAEAVTMVYDANGNQTQVTDALGNAVTRTYSTANQLLTETTSNASTPVMINQGEIAIVGNDIVKTRGNNAWGAGSFRSSDSLTGGASISFSPAQNDKALMVGLNSDAGVAHDWSSLDYAIYCTNIGELQVRESGSGNKLTSTVTYIAGDDLRVTYDNVNKVVNYVKNGSVFWTTAVTITQALFADSSFYNVGGKITDVVFGATPTTGWVPLLAESNATVTAGGTVTKTSGISGAWDSSVRSIRGETGGAMVSFRPGQTNKYAMVGLNSDPALNDSYASIDYAMYCMADGTLCAYESGKRVDFVPATPTYTTSDTLKVVYTSGKVQYLKISGSTTTVLREVAVTISSPLYLDSSFYSMDARIDALQFGRTGLTTVMAAARESGAAIVGDTITKTGGTSGYWDSAVQSEVGYAGQANLSFVVAQNNRALMVGLNTDPDANLSITSLDYAFYCRADGMLEVREMGASDNKLGTAVAYAAGDKLQITYDGAYVHYLKNGVELLKTAATISAPLYMDSSFCHVGGKITNIRFSDRAQPELTMRYVYSATKPGQLRYAITPEGRVTQYQYNSYGERTAQITYPRSLYSVAALADDELPTEAQMDTWASGNLATGARKEFTYDARGLVSYVYEYEGITSGGAGTSQHYTQYIYDQAGRLLQTVQMGGTSGDEVGSCTTTYTYDGLGRVLTVTDPRGVQTSTVYTDSAQKVAVTYDSGAVATSTYDKAGRLISLARSGAGSTTYAYDKAGRVLMTTDALGVKTFNIYDEIGRLVGTVDGDGTLTETSYDRAGRITRVCTYATAVSLDALYDTTAAKPLEPALADIRPTSITADLYVWSYYDDAGRLLYQIADNGSLTRHDYDGAGRLVRKVRYSVAISASGASTASITAMLDDDSLRAGAAQDRSERYLYDADGLLTATIDAEGYFTRHTYDNAGRKVQTRRYANPVAEAERAGGGRVADLLPVADSVRDQVETFFYDARGLLIAQADAGGYLTRNVYNNRGLLSSQTRFATRLQSTPVWTDSVDTLIGLVGTTADDRTSTWYYNRDGQLLKSINFEGTSTFHEYDTAGRLIRTTHGYGRTDKRVSEYRYDAWGRKTAQLDGEGAAKIVAGMTQTAIDAVWTSDGEDFAYDSAGRLISTTDANNFKTLYFYDVDGRLTHTVNARGEVEETQYNALGQRTAVVRYGTAIATTGLVGGLVNTTLTTRLSAVADAAKDSITRLGYNSAGRLYSTTSAIGAVSYTSYNTFGEVSELKTSWQGGVNLNVDQRIERFSYDRRGLLASTTRDVGGIDAITATEYDAFGRVTKSTNANGKSQTFAYDKLGRVVTTTDPLTKSVTTTYDAFGQVLTVKDQIGQTTGKVTSYTYDRAARSVTMLTPEGVSVVTTRTVYGQTYTVKDGNNNTTTCTYDRDGLLTETKVGTTIVETRDHDTGGRLISSTNANGVQTTYTYDAANRMLTRTVDPTDADTDVELNLVTKWEYDAKGQTVKVTDPRNVVTEYTFDLEGRTIKQVVDPTGLALTTDWTYDAEGRVLTVTDPERVVTQYLYNKLGWRVEQRIDPGTGNLNLNSSWSYDPAGNVLRKIDAAGHHTRYLYDANGRLFQELDAEYGLTEYTYDAAGRVSHKTRYAQRQGGIQTYDLGSGIITNSFVSIAKDAALDQVTRYFYDDNGRLEYTVDAIGAVTKNAYDGNGNVTSITRYADVVGASDAPTAVVANATLDHVTRIQYDAFNRETYRADPLGSVTRNEYDLNGNLIRRTAFYNTVAANVAPSAVIANTTYDRVERYVYDAANRVTHSSDVTGAVTRNSYDKNGNVTEVTRYATLAPNVEPDTVIADADSDRITSYFYDNANRRTYTVDSLGYVTLNAYDKNGNVTAVRRYADLPDSRSTPATAVANDTNDRVQRFEYDDANRLTKSTDALGNYENYTYDGAGNKLTFTNKNRDTWTYTYNKVGRLLTEKTPAVALYNTTRNNTDGTITLSGPVTVAVTTTLAYDSFGNLTSRTEADGRAEERVTSYAYDKLGRQVKVTYPPVAVHAELTSEVAANLRLDEAARDEVAAKSYTTQTWYDSFGNAVSSVDRNGSSSFKAYDNAGRVKYEIDALGYITHYFRNTFGEVSSQRRYATATTLANTAPTDADKGPTVAEIDAAIAATGFSTNLDRTLSTSYDKLGRVTVVYEPVVFTYNSSSGQTLSNYGKRTYTTYNAFGEVIRVGESASVNTSGDSDVVTYQFSYHYYDQGGRKTATADAGGYLTTYAYDSEGNLKTQLEYSTKMSVAASIAGYTAPAADAELDRTTTWAYDKLNRKTSETKVDATYYSSSTTTSVSTANGNLTTTYGYDAVGNLTRTTDAAGGITYTYYDELGRIRAVAAPSRTSTTNGATLVPLVEFMRDAYGNVIAKYDRVNTATSVTETGYAIAGSTADRVTRTLFDTSGNARQVQDAQGYQRYSAYTADGKLAKSWQTVTDNEGDKSTIYAAYYFDKLGRLQNSYAPSPVGTNTVSTNYRYNAFGEVTARGKNSLWQEYFEYDNAGRLWKTNSDDGNAKVFLYDLLGRQTAEITSAGSGRQGSIDVATATSAAEAAGWSSTRRVDIKYDALGHVTQRLEAERMITEGGITVRKAVANASIVRSNQPFQMDGEPYKFKGTTPNTVSVSWTSLSHLGSGDVRVVVSYKTLDTSAYEGGNTGAARGREFIYAGDNADTGVSMTWYDTEGSKIGGVGSITSLVVYKKDINGEWVEVINRNPGAGRAFGTWGTQIEIGAPVDPTTSVTFKYKASGAASFTTVNDDALVKFGDAYWFNAAALTTGTYDYEVYFTNHHLSVDNNQDGDIADSGEVMQSESGDAARRTESGSFAVKTDDSDDATPTNNWMRPTQNFKVDRWGNVLERNDPRQTSWKTFFTYNRDNQVVTEIRPDAITGDKVIGTSPTNSPVRTVFYDKLGRQRAVQDARGYVNTTEWDAGGNLVKEVHADGGVVTYLYDAFGQKVRTIDALGNASTDTAFKADHTTAFAYDKLGRLLSTTHGTGTGAANVWGMNTSMVKTGGGRQNIVESFTYDEAGRKRTQTNGAGEVTKYWYDRAGNVVKTLLPMAQYSTATFDAFGHKLTEVDANGNSMSWGYDYFGELNAHTDLDGKTFSYQYDTAGQLTRQTSSRGQDLTYGYDAAGQLISIYDAKLLHTTTYAYDLAGHRIRERFEAGTAGVLQDNHLAYDTQGRLIYNGDNRVQMTFAYDKAGNRTHVQIHTAILYNSLSGVQIEYPYDSDRWYTYDAMNRQTSVDAINGNGDISATQGHKLTYDLNGNRATDTFYGNKVDVGSQPVYVYDPDTDTYTLGSQPTYTLRTNVQVTEKYSYDALNRLQIVDRDNMIVDHRLYDGASRVVQSGPDGMPLAYAQKLNDDVEPDQQIGLKMNRMRYDANGRLLYQRVYNADGSKTLYNLAYEGTGQNSTTLGYDKAGNVLAYEYRNVEGGSYTNTTKMTLGKFDSYVEAHAAVESTLSGSGPGSTTSSYNVNGHLVSTKDSTESARNRDIINDASGHALRIAQGGEYVYSLIVNGELLGQHGRKPDDQDPRNQWGGISVETKVEFGFGYKRITGSYPAPGVGAFTVRAGDSLQTIAQAAYGDSTQWWRIAQANGLQSDRDLRVGQTITLPSIASGSANSSSTFKPYNPSEVVGDTSPNLPLPKAGDEGCGTVGLVIMVVVAIVVTYLTAGAASTYFGVVMSQLSASSVAIAAGAAAVGSIASQAVGERMGVAKFSWKQVAASAIGGAVTAGVGGALSGASSAINNVVVRAAISNALTQSISVAVGAQEHFSWKGVAAAAVGAAVGEAINSSLLGEQISAGGSRAMDAAFAKALGGGTMAKMVSGTLAGIASGATVAGLRGGRFSMQQVAADAFGNALGSSIVDSMSTDQTGANARSDLNKFNRENDADYYGAAQASALPDPRLSGALSTDTASELFASWHHKPSRDIPLTPDLAQDAFRRLEIEQMNSAANAGAAQQELERIDEVLRETRGRGPTRAGLYNDLVQGTFRDFDNAGQRTMLAAMDSYANALQGSNAIVATGLEARRADVAVRSAADLAYESGAIPVEARFEAQFRAGREITMGMMGGALARRLERNGSSRAPYTAEEAAARQQLAAMAKIEPQVTKTLSQVAEANNGEMIGLEYRLKSVESLARKLTDQPGIPVNDALRYTMSFDEASFTAGTKAAMSAMQEQGYQLTVLRNTFKDGQPYKGINTTYLTPEGEMFELQFHTPTSFKMKDVINHPLYEQQRVLPRTDPAWTDLRNQMIENSASVPIPPAASSIKKPR